MFCPTRLASCQVKTSRLYCKKLKHVRLEETHKNETFETHHKCCSKILRLIEKFVRSAVSRYSTICQVPILGYTRVSTCLLSDLHFKKFNSSYLSVHVLSYCFPPTSELHKTPGYPY